MLSKQIELQNVLVVGCVRFRHFFGTVTFFSVTLLKISHNLAYYLAIGLLFCRIVGLDNTYVERWTVMMMVIIRMMIMMMMLINIMMKIKISITPPIFKLGGPDFAWYKI